MPLGYLDWNIRETNGELSKDKGWTLVMLYSRSDALGRCYPSQSTIMKEVGCASEKLNNILDWLVERGAVIKVDVEHRINQEQKLNPRQTVYQLTGILRLEDGTWKNYLCLQNKETIKQVAYLIRILRKSNDTTDLASVFEEMHYSIFEQRPAKDTSKIEHEGNTVKDKVIQKEGIEPTFIEAWLKSLPVEPIENTNPYGNKSYRSLSSAASKKGFTAEDVAACSKWLLKGRGYIKYADVIANLPSWKLHHTPTPQPTPAPVENPARPDYPHSNLSAEQHAQLDALFADAESKL